MYSSTSASVPIDSWMKRTRSSSFASSSTTDACEMPIEASSVSDLTISGKRSRRGRRTIRLAREHREVGERHAVVREHLLGERLVAREHQAARVAAGVRHLQQLEVGHHVRVPDRDVVEGLDQVEGDLRLPVLDRARAAGRGRRRSPSTCTSWPSARRALTTSYSVFHSARAASLLVRAVGRHQALVHERQHPQLAARLLHALRRHSGTRWRPSWRCIMVRAVSSVVNSSRASSSGPLQAQPQLAAARHHVVEHLVDHVEPLSRPAPHAPAHLAPDARQEAARRAGSPRARERPRRARAGRGRGSRGRPRGSAGACGGSGRAACAAARRARTACGAWYRAARARRSRASARPRTRASAARASPRSARASSSRA